MALSSHALLASLPSEVAVTEAVHQALHYCGTTRRFGFGSKSPGWSTHAILLRIATQNSVILHLLIAASLAEYASYNPTAHGHLLNAADGHYEEGRNLPMDLLPKAEADPLVVMASFCAWMCEYLNRRPFHLELSSAFTEENQDSNPSLSPETCAVLARLTVWLFWADTQASLVGGGQMAQLLEQRVSYRGMISLHDTSRMALQLYWGSEYPDKQAEDDIQNGGALELVHQSWVLVQEINERVPYAPPGAQEKSEYRRKARCHAGNLHHPLSVTAGGFRGHGGKSADD
ncbi:hypothetical protein B0T14DRAFT_566241 [Immersiella caudata]|uniref:Transcription factor domain-containing protein n=1 Tax=Immersiella caudata TaxID=314043 RepID=A0AA39WQ98_9PEZI|nr:hypothetical protein B0T14DRAFT_566241 [Immersiella caudata]